MNAVAHRLIFNTARGCLMPVAETARSVGKGRSTGRKLKTRSCPQSGRNPITSSIYASNRPLVIADKFPIATPVINEVIEALKNSGPANKAKEKVNK